jgi:hypothetical protein
MPMTAGSTPQPDVREHSTSVSTARTPESPAHQIFDLEPGESISISLHYYVSSVMIDFPTLSVLLENNNKANAVGGR